MATPKSPDSLSGVSPVPSSGRAVGRKPWKKKTPFEVFLDQEERLRREVELAEEELQEKRKQLEKFNEARKIFEAS